MTPEQIFELAESDRAEPIPSRTAAAAIRRAVADERAAWSRATNDAIRRAVAEEREACARLAEGQVAYTAFGIATAIRARGARPSAGAQETSNPGYSE